MLRLPYLPTITVLPAAAIAVPLTMVSVLVSPASTSVSLAKTLSAAVGVPEKAVLPGFTPDSTTFAISGLATGGSFFGVILMVKIFGVVSNSPKLSCTLKVKLPAALVFKVGVKTRLPAIISAIGIILVAETGLPLSVSVPLVGKVSMRTALRVCAGTSASVKAKSACVNVRGKSSVILILISALSGGVLVPTFTVSVLLLVPPWPSLML